MDLRRIEITAPGLSAPLLITAGLLDSSPKVERRGGLVRDESGATAAGFVITNSTPDLYEYEIKTWLTKEDNLKLQRILYVQTTAPRTIQYADILTPIFTDRINNAPNRTGLGTIDSSADGDVQNFQSFCVLFNNTPGEELDANSGPDCRYYVELKMTEIC